MGQNTFYCLNLLSSINDRYLIAENFENICKYLLAFSREEDGISFCRYPILVCVLAAEFLYRLGRLSIKHQYLCYSVAVTMLELGESLESAVKDEEILNYYLKEQTDYINRSALEIIAENRFYELLNDENVAAIVSKLWYGSGKNLSLWKFSRITRILGSNVKHELYDEVINRTKIEMKTKNYTFQYEQYIKNCSFRYLVDSLSCIITTVMYQLIIYFYVNLSKVGDPDDDLNFVYFKRLAHGMVFTGNLNSILYLFYVYKTKQNLKFNFWILLDIFMFSAVLFNFLGISRSIALDNQDVKELLDSINYSLIIVCACMKIISILMTTKTFGPFIRVIYLLLWTIINFLLVFFSIKTVCAQIFTIIFQNSNPDYEAFFKSWLTLFNASFGIIDISKFKEMKIFGYVLIITYTTLSNVILLNLVIALIDNLFYVFEKKADAENRAVLVLTYERIKWNDEYGLLILLPAPINILSFFYTIILLISPDSKKEKLNKIFSKISYFSVAVANFGILILCSFLFLPMACAKSLLHSAYDNHAKLEIVKFYHVIYAVISRPFVLIFYIMQDIYNFWRICYSEAEEQNVEKKNPLVNKEYILKLRKILFYYKFKHNKKTVTIDQLYNKLGIIRKNLKETRFNINNLGDFSNIISDKGLQTNSNTDSISSKYSSDYGSNLKNKKERKVKLTEGVKKLYNNIKEEKKKNDFLVYIYLIDKFADKEKLVDIDRTLALLPERVKYSKHFTESLEFTNIRFILSGTQNFFFINALNNPVNSYKKLQNLINKILIKFKMILSFIPEISLKKLKNEFVEINNKEKFSKNDDIIRKMEEVDELSDFDDQVDYLNDPDPNFIQNINNNNYADNTI